MLTSIRCRNYKCFEDTMALPIAPLTVLVGGNSSGKTSLIQAFKLFSLTADTSDPAVTLKLLDREYDFGSYRDLVHRHEVKRKIAFEFGAEIELRRWRRAGEAERSEWTLSLEYQYLPRRKEIHLAQTVLSDSKGEWFTANIDKYTKSIRASMRGYDLADPLFSRLHFNRDGFAIYSQFPDFLIAAKEEKARALFDDLSAMHQAQHGFVKCFRSVGHLGPLRSPPRRAYLHSGETPQWVGPTGEATLQLYSSLHRRGWPEDRAKLALIHESLWKLGFLSSFEFRDVGARWQEFVTQHKVSGLTASLADTGFGASQVLPVIVSLFASKAKSTLVIEQPEIHLHPAAQAELGTVIASAVEPTRRIVLETHSENLILRLQREVASRKGLLSNQDVAFYYLEPQDGKHAVVRLELDAKGRFTTPWPKGFFEEGYREAMELSRERREPRRAGS